MIKHVSVFTLKDKMEIDHFITLLEEVGNDCSLIVNSDRPSFWGYYSNY